MSGHVKRASRCFALAAVAIGAGAMAGPARADGYQPFYGYSPYFGRPGTYFTPESDVQQVTTPQDASFGFGKRTYYRGGPFWTYHPAQTRSVRAVRRSRTVLRTKG